MFLYLLFGADATGAAVAVLAIGGTTDWVDGWVARRFGQVSRVGELLDPLVDRLYIAATVVAFTIEEVVPLAFTAALVARELVLLVCLGVLRRYGFGPPPVHYLGKTATFVLLVRVPGAAARAREHGRRAAGPPARLGPGLVGHRTVLARGGPLCHAGRRAGARRPAAAVGGAAAGRGR